MNEAIICKGLSKQYKDLKAVNDISFSVGKGRVVALLGPNGAGKTTTVKMLTTVSQPDSGTASICGYDIMREAMQVRRIIGVVPQRVWLNHYLSLKDNIFVYLLLHGTSWREAKRKTAWAMEIFGLDQYAKYRCEELSGGLRRRAQIARVLATDSKCFFLDEPSVGLDPSVKLGFWEQVGNLVRESGATTFLTTHSMEEVEALCDEVILLNHGEVVATGSVKQMMTEIGETEVQIEFGSIVTSALETQLRLTLPEAEIHLNQRNDGMTLRMKDSQSALPRVLKAVTDSNVLVKSLKVLPPRFEDVYLSLVGETKQSGKGVKEGGNR